jgi:hypothetical protein
MAFDKNPATWLGAGYTTGTNTIIFNTSNAATNQTLPQLTNAEAAVGANAGDIREIMFAMVDKFYNAYNAAAVADRPNKLSILRTGSTTATGNIVYNYNFQIEVAPSAVNVAGE